MTKILTFILCLIQLHNQMAQAKSEAQYWDDVGLAQEHLQDLFLSERKCESSGRYFSSCLWSLSQWLSNRFHRRILIQHERALFDNKLELKSLSGGYVLSVLPNSQANQKEINQQARQYLSFMEQKLRDLNFESFEALIQAAFSLPDDAGKLEARSIDYAKMFNSFVSVYESSNSSMKPVEYLGQQSGSSSDYVLGLNHRAITVHNRQLLLVEHLPFGFAARKKGLKVGDLIVSINGESGHERMMALLNEERRQVLKLQVERETQALTVSFKRDELKINNVEHEQFHVAGRLFDYIRVRGFMSQSTCYDMRALATKAQAQKVQGLVLDLRDNGGGYVMQAHCLLGLLLEQGNIKDMRGIKNGRAIGVTYYSREDVENNYYSKVPMVVLIDGNSASASEIVAGNLQVFAKAFLVGERSYGKGVFQSIDKRVSFSHGGVAGKPVAFFRNKGHYFLANGSSPQLKGLLPEFTVFSTPKDRAAQDIFRMEDVIRPVESLNLTLELDLLQLQRKQQIDQCLQQGPVMLGHLKAHESDDLQKDRGLAVLACQHELGIPVLQARRDYPKTFRTMGQDQAQLPLQDVMAF